MLVRGDLDTRARVFNAAQATARVVVNAMCCIGVAATLGTHRGYVNLCREMLFDDSVLLLPPERLLWCIGYRRAEVRPKFCSRLRISISDAF